MMFRSRSNRGITLIETMVALGVAAVLMLAILQIIQISAKSNRDVKLSFDKSNAVSNIRQLLNNEDACRTFMTESALQLNAGGGAGAVWALPAGGVLRFNGSDVVSVSVAPAIPPRQGVWATQVSVINQSGAGVDLGGGNWRHTADLVLSLQKYVSNDAGAIQAIGGPTVETLTFTAIVAGTAGNQAITGCFGEFSEEAICALFGAVHNDVDPAAPRCIFDRFGVVQNAGEWGSSVAPKPAAQGHTFVGGDLFMNRTRSVKFGLDAGGGIFNAQIQDTAGELIIHGSTSTVDASRRVRIRSGAGMVVEAASGGVDVASGDLFLTNGELIFRAASTQKNISAESGTLSIRSSGTGGHVSIAASAAGIPSGIFFSINDTTGRGNVFTAVMNTGDVKIRGGLTLNFGGYGDGSGNVPYGCHLVASSRCFMNMVEAVCPGNERAMGGGVRCPTNVDFIRSSTRGAAETWQGVCQRIGLDPGSQVPPLAPPALTSTSVCPAAVHVICCRY